MLSAAPWLIGWPRLDAPASCIGRPLAAPPHMIVIHSGASSPAVAEYLHYMLDGRKASAHFAWSSQVGGLVQMVPLTHEAMHAGCGDRVTCKFHGLGTCDGRYEGQRVNAISWGIELPGPWKQKRDADQHDKLVALIGELVQLASIDAIVAHSAICKDRKDPGPGLDWTRLEGFGTRLMR
jgi:N-acetyl-anhydromuramyl-L-alanine amidase AmpD